MIHTISATPLDQVSLEPGTTGTHVWLRKNLTTSTIEDQEVYEADEVYFFTTDPITTEDVTDAFDTLWSKHSVSAPSTEAQLAEVQVALAELADLIGGE